MRAIVFDLDGTLIDSAPDIQAAANKMLRDQGLMPLDLATVTSFIGNGLPKLVERVMVASGIDMAEHARLTKVTLAHYNAASADLTVPYPNLMTSLNRLKTDGYAMGICTNKPEAPARDILRQLEMEGFFDVVIGGDSLAVKKPEPEPLLAAFEQLGAGRKLYVGDSEVDAETARRAEVDFALFTEGYRKVGIDKLPFSYSFSDFCDLPDIAATALNKG